MNKSTKAILLSTSLLFSGVSPIVLGNPIETEAAVIQQISMTTTANVNMRTGASTSYKVIMTVPKGARVVASEKVGSWYKVSYTYSRNGSNVTKTGWMTGDYLAYATTKFTRTTYKTTDSLNLRTGPGTSFKTMLTIPNGKVVTSSERMNNWYKAAYTYKVNGTTVTKTGWVSGSYLKAYDQFSTITTSYYFTNKTASLFPNPDTRGTAAYALPANNGFNSTQKAVNRYGETMYRVSYQGKTLYIKATDVLKASAQTIAATKFKAKMDTYVYASYGTSFSKLIKIPKDTVISTSYKVGSWYKVSYGGKTGFAPAASFVTYAEQTPVPPQPTVPNPVPTVPDPVPTVPDPVPTPAPNPAPVVSVTETAISGKTYLTTTNLNLRQSYTTDSSEITTIPNSTFVFPTAVTSNGWYKVSYAGKTGYVFGDYLLQVVTGDPMHRNGYQFIDLRKPSLVTASQINAYIDAYVAQTGKASVLRGKGQAFIDAGNRYGVNALYLAANAIHESGFGTSNLSLGKFNLFGFGAYDATPFVAAYRFATVDQCIAYIAQEIKATYLNPNNWKHKGAYLGYSTKTAATNTRVDEKSEGMNFYYASDPKWGQKIASHMEKIRPYNKAEYDSATANLVFPARPSKPAGYDRFPAGITAGAKQNLNLTAQKGSTTVAKTIGANTVFTLLEKHNDYWVKLSVNGVVYWTNSIKFDVYNQYITVKNLGRVTADSLNVRPTASTAQAPIAALDLNQYVQLKLDSTGKVITDNTAGWYNVKLADGREGWVSKSYIYRELP
ncbi:SH3 domain-containing protein [Bacillus massilinigeriensis]|uniref:SH3 domain-containing protein n=1 Tax=Bacillus mediterraneensis TaxID=1805474 RepID=UPI0009F345E8|nr:SH3 domain-containing protein [Bacillus mediterraneensis]